MILLKKFGRSWYEEIYESDTRFPQQFIYSTGDELINYEGKQAENHEKKFKIT